MSVDSTRELASGSVAVQAFPDNLTAGWARLLQGKNVAAVDAIDGLSALLAGAGVDCTRMDQVSELQFGHLDLVLIAADRLDESPFSQSFIIRQARAGAGVMIFEQSKISRLVGYAVVSRARPDRLEWMRTHPLLTGFSADDLKSWIDELPLGVSMVRLPRDASALQIAGWPKETAGDGISKSSDAMILSQSVGSGHIVWCQLPLGSWRDDPRTVMLLGNALDYLSAPTEQTSANRRQVYMPAMQVRVPMVLTPAGDNR